jgi:integrase
MSIRRRTWTTNTGEHREAWIVDYVDQAGARHIETFARRRDADARQAAVKVNVRAGIHTATSGSPTVAGAAEAWLRHVELEGRERGTLRQYRQHVRCHIVPRIGRMKLAALTTPAMNRLCDELLADLSRAMAKKVLVSLKAVLKDAQRRGDIAQNVALGVSIRGGRRSKLRAGIDIPTRDEIRRIVHAASGSWRPLLLTASFTGLRSSELRGLIWDNVDLKRGEIHVRQRADHFDAIGKPKSLAGERVVPLGPFLTNTLREWKLACPQSRLDLVFPTQLGNITKHARIIERGLIPTMIAAGVVNADGKAKYTGLHALRHFYASWCINRRSEGGLELPAKIVQERLGHASITLTMDVYGHLVPRTDDGAELAAAEQELLA